ncbi:two-component system sensor histidine kinase TctE [Gemmobacter caeni]|uniref:histidine kinase n=2 Tax=Gemmobacter TaxID=204456 RepID=A0A2T6B4K8_9RHOB|nr:MULTISPECIES: sensor histidine kinase [Gemmobacter]PTX51011.1 two-component system sensor histidine kinase TctE [Gemmobacter caeni]TWJ01011.1 two-component system sensor histidine kinase TctE [Gemmobacter caeni]GHC18947.1 two-component system sensor kinase [Gemmobacter nanjingensis]
MKRPLSRLSLRGRLFLLLVTPLVVLATVLSISRFVQFSHLSRQIYDNTLYTVALTISRDVMLSEGDMLADQLLAALTQSLGDRIYYRITGPDGAYITGYSAAPRRPEGKEPEPGVPLYFDTTVNGLPGRALTLIDTGTDPDTPGVVTIEVWQTVEQRNTFSRELIAQTIAHFSLIVLAAASLVWFGITFGLRPLRELEEAILARSPDDLRPIRRWVPPELRTLVGATNSLFQRLTRAFALRDAFISDAAHQVRNPIAALQAQAEAAQSAPDEATLRRRLAEVVTTARSTGRLTNQLLSMERVRGRDLRSLSETVDLVALTGDVTRDFAARFLAGGGEVTFDVIGTARPIQADTVLLREMLANLLDNAQIYAGPKAQIAVRVEFTPDAAMIEVADNGPGIPPHLHERVFDRFYRLDHDTVAGCGLGLAIVRDIAQSHGGSAEVRPDTQGCTLRIRLPD